MHVGTQKKSQSGMTFVELMIVLTVSAVILAISAPSMKGLLQKNRLQVAADNFFTDLMLARSEAVKRNQPVVICKSTSGAACVTAGDWEQGWMVYADIDSDGVKDAGEPILKVGDALQDGDTLRVTGVATAFADQLAYRTDGSSSGVDGNETFVFCDAELNLTNAREILVTITGRPRRQQKTTGSCPV